VTKNTSPKQSLGNDYTRDRDRHRQIVALSLGSQDLRDTWTCRTTFCQTLNKVWSGTTYGDLTEFITHTPDIVLFPTHVLVCGEYEESDPTVFETKKFQDLSENVEYKVKRQTTYVGRKKKKKNSSTVIQERKLERHRPKMTFDTKNISLGSGWIHLG
jgi:hypothetical protein